MRIQSPGSRLFSPLWVGKTLETSLLGMRHFQIFVTSFALLTTSLACDAYRSYRRASRRDLGDFVALVKTLKPVDDAHTFDAVAKRLACTRQEHCESFEIRCAEGKGQDAFTSTHVWLAEQLTPKPGLFELTVMAFPIPRQPELIDLVRKQLGAPQAHDDNGRPAWIVPAGALVITDSSLDLTHPATGGDIHDHVETISEPSLPTSPDKVLARIDGAIAKRGGTHGYLNSAEKLVAISMERSPLPDEACIDNLAAHGREICVGRLIALKGEAVTVDAIHASSTIRKGGAFVAEDVITLINDSVGKVAAAATRDALQHAGEAPITIARAGNFAVVVTQQLDHGTPWDFRHVLVMRRVALFPQRETDFRSAWSHRED
jgi:hypothetical protein